MKQMTSKFYKLIEDVAVPEDSIVLGEIDGFNNWDAILQPVRLIERLQSTASRPLPVEVVKRGTRKDFLTTAAYGLVVVSARLKNAIEASSLASLHFF